MPKLYLHLTKADDSDFMLGQPIAMVAQGTAEEVAKLCAAINMAMEMLGFKTGGK